MTHRLLPLAVIPALFILGACSDDGRDMKIPAGNQNESIMTTTLPVEGDASFETPAPSRPRNFRATLYHEFQLSELVVQSGWKWAFSHPPR